MGKQQKKTRSTPNKTKQTAQSARPSTDASQQNFPVVGIGASAGGLEALEIFFEQVPPASGVAFVIVQHLDPTHKGIMVELLQHKTDMPVMQIKDRTKVQPNHIYVIPPNHDLSILHGTLHLLDPTAPRGLRLPIDFFLHSLATDQQEQAIAVILSGMGSDGTLALRSIKEKGGGIFVQDPSSAKFDGMPRSAIDQGLVDVIAPAEELPGRIMTYLQHVSHASDPSEVDRQDKNQSGLEKVVLILRTQTGHDFSLYKKNTLYRRIERRMGLHQLSKIADYVRYLRENPQESTLLFKELLIGVTSFFRDPAVWEQLKSEIIPELLADQPSGREFRAWIPGCSTGEEAYTLAILFQEALDKAKPPVRHSLQIFATDLDTEAIDQARIGVYQENILANVTEDRLRRFFVQEERGYRVCKEIREMVIFAPQNLVMDPPFTKLDLLSCRNLLIYLEPALQKKILTLFHYSLNPNGVLILGSAETAGQSTHLFAPLPGKTRIYRRQQTPQKTDLAEFPTAYSHTRIDQATGTTLTPEPLQAAPNLQELTDSLLLRHHTPAAVLTTSKGDLLYISGKTGKYLEPAMGKANLNLFAMAREGLSAPLHEAFNSSLHQKKSITLAGIKVGTNGGTQLADITVQPVNDPEALRGSVLVVFTDRGAPSIKKTSRKTKLSADDERLTALSLDLQQSREELQTTREEMQSSQEELKSANEELQSTNEELQSTNEELTTSKEEMQSMNEELQTVNHELQAKVDELSLVSDDMKNLLNSIEIATLFLDNDLKVRRFTTQVTSIFKLIPGDAGRPITDIVNTLDYPQLIEHSREVLRSLVPIETHVAANDDQWFAIRIMPYRTQDNRIDGVVITFLDITESQGQKKLLTEALSALMSRVDIQSEKLNRAQILEAAAEKAQAVLEQLLQKKNLELKRVKSK